MSKQFKPEVLPRVREGRTVYEVDCRSWPRIMREMGRPLRRRFNDETSAEAYRQVLVVQHATGQRRDLDSAAVQELADRYLISVKRGKSHRTWVNYRSVTLQFVRWCRERGIVYVSDVSPLVGATYLEWLKSTYAPRTQRTMMSTISGMFQWAKNLMVLDFNPFDRLVPPMSKEESRRSLTLSERRAILEMDSPYRDVWVLFLLTGLRRREMALLTEADVVLDSPAPHLKVTGKGRKRRNVPLHGQALELARRLLADAVSSGRGRFSPLSYSWSGERWLIDRRRAQLANDITIHTFRHTFATVLANATGSPLTMVRTVLGHSSVVTTEIYVHDDERRLRLAMAELGTLLVSDEDQGGLTYDEIVGKLNR